VNASARRPRSIGWNCGVIDSIVIARWVSRD
jgi:hypothetical protein